MKVHPIVIVIIDTDFISPVWSIQFGETAFRKKYVEMAEKRLKEYKKYIPGHPAFDGSFEDWADYSTLIEDYLRSLGYEIHRLDDGEIEITSDGLVKVD